MPGRVIGTAYLAQHPDLIRLAGRPTPGKRWALMSSEARSRSVAFFPKSGRNKLSQNFRIFGLIAFDTSGLTCPQRGTLP